MAPAVAVPERAMSIVATALDGVGPLVESVVDADVIHVVDKGRIVEEGSHDQLRAQADGLYARLWRMQDGGLPTEGDAA